MPNLTTHNPSAPIRIGLLVFAGCMPTGLFAAADLLRAVNRRLGKQMFEPAWIGVNDHRINFPFGPTLELLHSREEYCDAYLLPGFWADSDADLDNMLSQQTQMLGWLRQLPTACQLWSYCMGVALLAASGRIDRYHATATWWMEKPLRQRFLAIEWDFHEPVIEDRGVITAAGANGYWALLRTMLSATVPAEILHDVEQAMLLPRSNTKHVAFRPVELMAQRDPELQRLIAYVQSVPAAELNVSGAANFLATSSRTLSRKIAKHTQVSAGEWLSLIKLRQVSHALLSSGAPIKVIAERLGYADDASLMRSFKRVTGITTSQFRRQYGNEYGNALEARRQDAFPLM